MKIKRLGLLTALAATGLFAAACAETGTNTARNASPAQPAPAAPAAPATARNIPFPDVERIPLAEAKKAFDDGSAIFVDTHSAASFEVQHVKGAVNIPPDQLAAKADSLPKGKKIIAYCS